VCTYALDFAVEALVALVDIGAFDVQVVVTPAAAALDLVVLVVQVLHEPVDGVIVRRMRAVGSWIALGLIGRRGLVALVPRHIGRQALELPLVRALSEVLEIHHALIARPLLLLKLALPRLILLNGICLGAVPRHILAPL